MLVECHHDRLFRNQGCDGHRLLRDPSRGIAGATFRNFMNLETTKAELAADVVKPVTITFREFPLRTLLQATDGDDVKAHWAFP